MNLGIAPVELPEGNLGEADAGRAGDCFDDVVREGVALQPEVAPLISFVEDESAFQVVVHCARDAAAGVAALDGELRLASFHEFEPLHEEVEFQ